MPPGIGYNNPTNLGSLYDSGLNFDDLLKNINPQLNQGTPDINTPTANMPMLGNFLQGAQGLAALYSIFNANKSRKLANKQFGFEKNAANRNLSNSANVYNTELLKRVKGGLALSGIQKDDPEYQKRLAETQQRYVDGSPIG